MNRTLRLRREALTDLTLDDLGDVVGGRYSNDGITCGITDCLQPLTTDQVITLVSRQITCYACVSLTAC